MGLPIGVMNLGVWPLGVLLGATSTSGTTVLGLGATRGKLISSVSLIFLRSEPLTLSHTHIHTQRDTHQNVAEDQLMKMVAFAFAGCAKLFNVTSYIGDMFRKAI